MNELAGERGQTLAQMALAWVLRHEGMTSVRIGASRVEQVEQCVAATVNLRFADEDLGLIEEILLLS